MANTFKFGNGNWAVKEDLALAYNDENGNFKPLPFDFTRASSASRVNKDGLLETVDRGMPRIDFLDNTSGHLLLEPSRTNNVPYSDDFTEWSVTASGTTLTSNSAISPDGSQTADLLESDGTNAFSRVYETVSLTSGNNCVYSTFVKKSGSHDFASIRVQGTDVGGAGQVGSTYTFTFSTETLSYEGGGSATSTFVENYGSGWYRIGMEVTNSTVTQVIIYPKFNSSVAGEILMWGAQLEEGSYATSYIPTSSATVTRLAETCGDAGNSQVFNSTEGVLFVKIEKGSTPSSFEYFSLSDGTTSNTIRVFFNTSNQIGMLVGDGGVTQVNSTYSTVYTKGDTLKVALKYKTNDFALWVNGVEVLTDTSGSVPTVDSLNFGRGDTNTSWYEKTKEVKIYNTALSDSELQALTS
jgi:hypothetical protein